MHIPLPDPELNVSNCKTPSEFIEVFLRRFAKPKHVAVTADDCEFLRLFALNYEMSDLENCLASKDHDLQNKAKRLLNAFWTGVTSVVNQTTFTKGTSPYQVDAWLAMHPRFNLPKRKFILTLNPDEDSEYDHTIKCYAYREQDAIAFFTSRVVCNPDKFSYELVEEITTYRNIEFPVRWSN